MPQIFQKPFNSERISGSKVVPTGHVFDFSAVMVDWKPATIPYPQGFKPEDGFETEAESRVRAFDVLVVSSRALCRFASPFQMLLLCWCSKLYAKPLTHRKSETRKRCKG